MIEEEGTTHPYQITATLSPNGPWKVYEREFFLSFFFFVKVNIGMMSS